MARTTKAQKLAIEEQARLDAECTEFNSTEKAEHREETHFQNAQALKAEVAGVHHDDVLVKHDLTMFRAIIDGEHGLNLKGRLLYTLNFMAQRILRDSLKDSLKKSEETDLTLAQCLSQEELSAMFGFESAPLYTLDKAVHWVFTTYVLAHDISQYTEADDKGMKSKPFSWIQDLIRNPFTMVASDMQFGIKASVDNQAIQMEKFGYREHAAASLEKFNARQQVSSNEILKTKIELIRQNCDIHTYKNMGTEEGVMELEEMIADLGLSIPEIVLEIAQKYKDKLVLKADEGKYLGDVDERIVDLLPKDATGVGTTHKASHALEVKVEAEFRATKPLDTHVAVTGSGTGKAPMRRITKADAAASAASIH